MSKLRVTIIRSELNRPQVNAIVICTDVIDVNLIAILTITKSQLISHKKLLKFRNLKTLIHIVLKRFIQLVQSIT